MANAPRYPEHEKMKALGARRAEVQSFIDWLYDAKPTWEIAEWSRARRGQDQRLLPVRLSRQDIMAQYFDIDLRKIDVEKDAMLEELRKANK